MSLEDLTPNELLAHAKTLEKNSGLFTTLINSPDTREETLKLLRKKNPNMPIPELDAKAAAEKALEEERKERQALEARVRENEIRDRIDKERERVKKKFELTDKDMEAVEKIMTREDAPIPHYDAAATVYLAEKRMATPTTSAISPPVFDMPEDKEWKKGVGNPPELNKVALKKAFDVWNEVRGGAKAA